MQLWVLLPGSRDEGLGSHEKQQHDEGADQVGVEHFVSHLEELEPTKRGQRNITRTFQVPVNERMTFLPDSPPALLTMSSMCVSLNTRVSGVMCSLCIRSLLRTSIACLMRLLISLEVDSHMLGIEPFVKEARIYSKERKCDVNLWCPVLSLLT